MMSRICTGLDKGVRRYWGEYKTSVTGMRPFDCVF